MMAHPWDSIESFHARGEFDRFVAWMTEQIAAGNAEELPVMKPYLDAPSFKEKWFQHIQSGSVWRLVWPDGPFAGLFEPVE